jgi:hypothetical protein
MMGDDPRHFGPDRPARRGVLAGALALMAAPTPALATSGDGGFDFLHGRWNVTHRKLRERLTGSNDWFEFPGTLVVEPILSGLGNIDRNVLQDPAGPYEASSLRLFDPKARKWSIYWLDARSRAAVDPPVVGGFEGHKGVFYSQDSFRGRPIRVRTTYEPFDTQIAEWTQSFSVDAGASWETNWIMTFRRAQP